MDKKIKYEIDGYKDAELIINTFSIDERYLRNLVGRVIIGCKPADSLDYRELLHYGYKIRGVAQKILRENNREKSKPRDVSVSRKIKYYWRMLRMAEESWDGEKYVEYADKLGLKPKDLSRPELYEQGLAEKGYRRRY